MSKLPKYNRTLDPEERITAYTYAGKGDDLQNNEFELVLMNILGKHPRKELQSGIVAWHLASQTLLPYQWIIPERHMLIPSKHQ